MGTLFFLILRTYNKKSHDLLSKYIVTILICSQTPLTGNCNSFYPILNGERVDVGATPWVVAIVDDNDSYKGVGIAIGDRWILTAAHTIARLGNGGRVVAGLTDLQDQQAAATVDFDYRIVQRILHDEYDAGDSDDEDAGNDGDTGVDLALIRVDRDLPATIHYMGPRTFEEYDNDMLEPGLEVYYNGWGRNGDEQTHEPVLRRGHNPINEVYHQTIEFTFEEGDPRPAAGDSGAPAYVYMGGEVNQYILIGMLVEADENRADAVRTDVHADWILGVTGIEQLRIEFPPESDDDESVSDDGNTSDDSNDETDGPDLINHNQNQGVMIGEAIATTAIIGLGIGIIQVRRNNNLDEAHIEPPVDEDELKLDEDEIPLIDNPQQNVPDRDGMRRRIRQAKDVEILDSCGKGR